jgi:hypothetical protein
MARRKASEDTPGTRDWVWAWVWVGGLVLLAALFLLLNFGPRAT